MRGYEVSIPRCLFFDYLADGLFALEDLIFVFLSFLDVFFALYNAVEELSPDEFVHRRDVLFLIHELFIGRISLQVEPVGDIARYFLLCLLDVLFKGRILGSSLLAEVQELFHVYMTPRLNWTFTLDEHLTNLDSLSEDGLSDLLLHLDETSLLRLNLLLYLSSPFHL